MDKTEGIGRRELVKAGCAACIAAWAAFNIGCKSKQEAEKPEVKTGEAAKMLAYCGIICSECEAYIATQNRDREDLQKVAAKWSEEYGGEITVESIICDGCKTTGGRMSEFCANICEIRKCALEKMVQNCAHCEQYPCEKLNPIFQMAPEAKTTLDSIKQRI